MGTDIGILKLLADPGELGRRLAESERATAAADAAVALVGQAQEIPKLLADAEAAEREAAEAARLRAAVAAEADAARDAMKDSADDLAAKQATIDALAEAAEDQHDAAQTELKRLKDIAERLRAVASEV